MIVWRKSWGLHPIELLCVLKGPTFTICLIIFLECFWFYIKNRIQLGYLYLYICASHFVHRTKRHGNDVNTVLPGGSETTKNFGPRSHLTRGRQLLLGQEFLGRLIGKEERSIWWKNPLSKNIKIFDEDDHHDDSRLFLPISLFYIIAIIFKKVKYYRCLSNAGVSPRYNVVNPSCLKTSSCYLDD